MKIRICFVSNSSSSSFVVAATLPAFREALSRIKDPRDVKIIKAVAEEDTIFGIKSKIIREYTDAGGWSSIWRDGDGESEILEKAGIVYPPVDKNGDETEVPEGEEWSPADAIYDYTKLLEDMSKEEDWKDQIFQCDVGDGG